MQPRTSGIPSSKTVEITIYCDMPDRTAAPKWVDISKLDLLLVLHMDMSFGACLLHGTGQYNFDILWPCSFIEHPCFSTHSWYALVMTTVLLCWYDWYRDIFIWDYTGEAPLYIYVNQVHYGVIRNMSNSLVSLHCVKHAFNPSWTHQSWTWGRGY